MTTKLCRLLLLIIACLLTGCSAPMMMRFDVAAIPRSNQLAGRSFAIDEVTDLRRGGAEIGKVYDFPFVWSIESEQQPAAVVRSVMEHMLLARGADVVGLREKADYFMRIRIVQLDFDLDVGFDLELDTAVALEVALYSSESGELLFRDRFAAQHKGDRDLSLHQLEDSVVRALDDALKRIEGVAAAQEA